MSEQKNRFFKGKYAEKLKSLIPDGGFRMG